MLYNNVINVVLLCLFAIELSESKFRVLEIDHVLDNNAPYYRNPGTEPFSLEIIEAGTTRGYWLAFGKFKANEHMGTHLIAPYTYNASSLTVDQIPVEKYFGEAAVIDIRSKVASDPNYELTENDVNDWVLANGVFPNNSYILVHTGWQKGRYPDQLAYFGDDKGLSNMKFPGVSIGAVKAVLNYEQTHGIHIIAFGIDCPRLERGQAKNRDASTLNASFNKFIVANLRNLEGLPTRGAMLMTTPIKIKNGAAAPARVLARLPSE